MSNIIHLFSKKLVNDLTSSFPTTDGFENDRQMSLPFSAPHVLYLITGETDVTREEFFHFINHSRVCALFDLRFSPRLDFLATTRPQAFSQIKEMKISYYDVFGRTGVASPSVALEDRVEILKEIVGATQKTLKNGQPCLMMFDNTTLSVEYEKLMKQYFEVRRTESRDIRRIAADFVRIQM